MTKHINELIDGDRGTYVYLVNNLNKGVTSKGAAYLSLTLQDKTGTIDAKLWSATPEQLTNYKAGMILEMNGEVLCHNKILQMRVNDCHVVDRSSVDLMDFVREGSIPRKELKEKITEVINSFENQKLKNILKLVMDKYEKDFYSYPAAAKIHHDFVGGLATHVWEMIQLAQKICEIFPVLNRELLLSGIILHDIGKCVELSGPVITEYTPVGKLIGHISIMQSELDALCKEHQIEGEEVLLLRHMILSHHGEYEYGSPVLPMIPEAEMLHYIDNMDARLNVLEKAYEGVEPGEFTQRIFAMENRSFYKSNLKWFFKI